MAFASKLLAFGARLPRALESAVVQLPSLLEPPAAQTAAEHAAARTTHDLAQLAQLVYTPLAEQPLAGRQPFGLTIDDGSCNLWEIVLCTDALSHLDPISGRVLAVPALCIFRSPEGLALSFRGTKTVDDARVDAYGMSWLEDAPKFGRRCRGSAWWLLALVERHRGRQSRSRRARSRSPERGGGGSCRGP